MLFSLRSAALGSPIVSEFYYQKAKQMIEAHALANHLTKSPEHHSRIAAGVIAFSSMHTQLAAKRSMMAVDSWSTDRNLPVCSEAARNPRKPVHVDHKLQSDHFSCLVAYDNPGKSCVLAARVRLASPTWVGRMTQLRKRRMALRSDAS